MWVNPNAGGNFLVANRTIDVKPGVVLGKAGLRSGPPGFPRISSFDGAVAGSPVVGRRVAVDRAAVARAAVARVVGARVAVGPGVVARVPRPRSTIAAALSGATLPFDLRLALPKTSTSPFEDLGHSPSSEPIALLRATKLGASRPSRYQSTDPLIVEAKPYPRSDVTAPVGPKVQVMHFGTEETRPRRREAFAPPGATCQNPAFGAQRGMSAGRGPQPPFCDSRDRNQPVELSGMAEEPTVEATLVQPKSKFLHWSFTALLAAGTIALFVEQVTSAR